jgi:hypothetical protein
MKSRVFGVMKIIARFCSISLAPQSALNFLVVLTLPHTDSSE